MTPKDKAMIDKQQTAVEWLMSRFESGDMYNVEDAQFIKHQAMKMEKEQIKAAYRADTYTCLDEDAEQYYNKTYNKNKQ